MSSSVVLILGAGANIGSHVAQKFSTNGYKVATASRSPKPDHSKTIDLTLKADFSNPSSIKDIFVEVKTKLGLPSVVIYNGQSILYPNVDSWYLY
jgi:NAD(P)-dependent dehydrogenase (short-subunit alcohol dehydrogenase family)